MGGVARACTAVTDTSRIATTADATPGTGGRRLSLITMAALMKCTYLWMTLSPRHTASRFAGIFGVDAGPSPFEGPSVDTLGYARGA
jgi:hypothetical protein